MGFKNIVFYGDSNTYGYTPYGERYDNRFTKIIESILDDNFKVFEEGLVGRTSIYPDKRENRCGINNVDKILGKYDKIDYLFIMLGTNDFKKNNARTINDYYEAMNKLLTKIISISNVKRLVLVSPILLSKNIEVLDNEFDYHSYLLSKLSSKALRKLAKEYNALFFDAKTVAKPGVDGEHFTQEGHYSLANSLIKIINSNPTNK